MVSNKGLCAGLIVLVAGIFFVFGFKQSAAVEGSQIKPEQAASASDQPAGNQPVMRLSAPAKVDVKIASAASAVSAFDAAARRNADLQAGLDWAFGGKSQRGWRLYVPLISSLIGVEEEISSSNFASALARWQKEKGLEPNGVLDNYAWSKMISTFQSSRIKDRAYPPADHLVTAPPSVCYDPSRPEELRKVERDTYNAYKRMIAAAAADSSLGLSVTANGELAASEKYLKIISAHRSREYQDQLRKQSPNSGRAGLAVNSPHFTGRALDLYVGGEPVSTKDENRAAQTRTRVYKWLVKNAARFGFQPYFYEPWHWEYVPKN